MRPDSLVQDGRGSRRGEICTDYNQCNDLLCMGTTKEFILTPWNNIDCYMQKAPQKALIVLGHVHHAI